MTNSMLEYGSAIPSLEAAELLEILEAYQDLSDAEEFLSFAEGAE
jgi:hypothetical protein